MDYCTDCSNCKHCFGCVGLKGKSYCIFNKQYTKEKYEELVPRIIEHMKQPLQSFGQLPQGKQVLSPFAIAEAPRIEDRSTRFLGEAPRSGEGVSEWGEFFPSSLSYFGYDQTIASEYYALDEAGAEVQGFGWMGEQASSAHHGVAFPIPDDITKVADDLIKQVLTCETCAKAYKVIAQELKFYRDQGLPVPKECFHCRHLARMAMRNPRRLYERTCGKCGTAVTTTYPPEGKETVHCEKCYQETIY